MRDDQVKIQPFISVIIPVRNRDDVIGRTLMALEQQNYPLQKFQVIVVDDGSSDETASILNDFIAGTRLNLTLLNSQGKGAGAARNIGLDKAAGDLVLLLDSDTIPEADLLGKHADLHAVLEQPACVMAKVDMSPQLVKADQFRLFDTRLPIDEAGPKRVDWTLFRAANTSIPLSAIFSVGGFDQNLQAAEDTELAYRLNAKGIPIYYSDSPLCVHHHPLDIDGYMQKGWVYGHAVAVWYTQTPKVRQDLVSRYGVTAPELAMQRKIKHALRSVLVNRYSVKYIIKMGKVVRSVSLSGSEILLKSAFRFNTRKAFSNYLQSTRKIAVG